MIETTYFQNYLLIAMPTMADPNFHHCVTYLCEHNENGAIGIIINRPTTITLLQVLEDMKIPAKDVNNVNRIPILFGGPVHQERGFVLHRPVGHWRATLNTGPEVAVTTSRDILEALAKHEGPQDVIVALGCSAWEAGQLEHEISENTWLTIPAEPEVIYSTPFEQRWVAAAAQIGIDMNNISSEVGHG